MIKQRYPIIDPYTKILSDNASFGSVEVVSGTPLVLPTGKVGYAVKFQGDNPTVASYSGNAIYGTIVGAWASGFGFPAELTALTMSSGSATVYLKESEQTIQVS